MASRRPIVIGPDGLPQQLQAGDKPVGSWAKAILLSALSGGSFTQDIPAGIFAALPVLSHAIETASTRDYVLRITGRTMNATTKVVTIAGIVRQSRMLPGTLLISGGNETFETLTSAVTLYLTAEESD